MEDKPGWIAVPEEEGYSPALNGSPMELLQNAADADDVVESCTPTLNSSHMELVQITAEADDVGEGCTPTLNGSP